MLDHTIADSYLSVHLSISLSVALVQDIKTPFAPDDRATFLVSLGQISHS